MYTQPKAKSSPSLRAGTNGAATHHALYSPPQPTQQERHPGNGGFVRLSHINQNPTNPTHQAMPVRYAPPIPQSSHSATRPLLAVLDSANSLADAYHEVHMIPNESEKAALLALFEKVFPDRLHTLQKAEAELPQALDYRPPLHQEMQLLFHRWASAAQQHGPTEAACRGSIEVCQLIQARCGFKKVTMWYMANEGRHCHNYRESIPVKDHFGVAECVARRGLHEEPFKRYWPVLSSVVNVANADNSTAAAGGRGDENTEQQKQGGVVPPAVLCVFELESRDASTAPMHEETQTLLHYVSDFLVEVGFMIKGITELQRSKDTLRTLVQSAEQLQVCHDNNEAASLIEGLAVKMLECDSCKIVRFEARIEEQQDIEGEEAVATSPKTSKSKLPSDWRMDLGFGYGRMIREMDVSKEPIVVHDLIKDTRFCFEDATVARVKSLLAVPVLHQNCLIGVMFLENKKPTVLGTTAGSLGSSSSNPGAPSDSHNSSAMSSEIPRKFTPDDATLAFSIALEFSVSCLTNKAKETAQRARDSDRSVLEVLRTVVNSDIGSVREVTVSILSGAKKLTSASRCHMLLLDKSRGLFVCQTTDLLVEGRADPGMSRVVYNGSGTAEEAGHQADARNKESNSVSEPDDDTPVINPFVQELLKQFPFSVYSLVVEPLVFDDQVMGVCVLVNKNAADGSGLSHFSSPAPSPTNPTTPHTPAHGGHFDKQDQEIFATLSMCATMVLHNSTLYDFAVQAAKEAVQLHRMSSELPSRISGESRSDSRGGTGKTNKDVIVITEKEVAQILSREDGSEDGPLVSDDLAALARTQHFDPLVLETTTAIRVLMTLFLETGLPQKFHCTEDTLARFIIACCRRYRKVFYHNFYHAVDVCQTIWFYLYTKGLKDFLEPLEQYVLLITALVHDLDHMGVNNSFHLKTDSPLGILSSASGTNSVLEVHHCNVAIGILDDPEKNVFAGLNPESHSTKAYKMLIDNVLATDMARHAEIVSAVKVSFEGGVDKENETHRRLLQQLLIKAADVSNVTKPFSISKKWAKRVTEEFYLQGDTEKAKGMGVLPMFDRSLNTELASGQLGFINFVAYPFFESIAGVLPEFIFAPEAVQDCKTQWQRLQTPDPEKS